MTNISPSAQSELPVRPTFIDMLISIKKSLGAPVILSVVIVIGLALHDMAEVPGRLIFTGTALFEIFPFLMLSVGTAAYLKASGADQLVARAFEGNPVRAIAVASVFGALSPFCSCGVIPLVAGLLAGGVPLAPVLAFCIASPIMDPEMFILTAASLGIDFALVKTAAAIGMGLFAGYVTLGISKTGLLANGLRDIATPSCGSSLQSEIDVQWAFWKTSSRNIQFWTEGRKTSWFLGRWLTFAFLLESLMVAYLPAENVAEVLGDGNAFALPLAALIGIPAYMNGYAAIPLVRGLMDLGMSPATALTFMLAGSVTCIPAAIGIWSLVKPKVFSLYLGFALAGSLIAGFLYQIALG
ncbi:hypothetical protein A9Q83_01040 [Alphaproteobacteria bacterium 46_93_T64]|nr:hypothetical protein A9Q83_01040 [Alphaproteobacteria bacterium 46_93_T64]